MRFIVLSQKEVLGTEYTSIKEPHLLISIRNIGQELDLIKSPYCKSTLVLNFDDVEDINEKNYFTMAQGREVIDFVNNHCHKADLIVCHCYAGISRSVAVASALSKIINHKDDMVYSVGFANSLVYIAVLESYFLERSPEKVWSNLHKLRIDSLKQTLSPQVFYIANRKMQLRSKGKDIANTPNLEREESDDNID